jgi:hypothetical protein
MQPVRDQNRLKRTIFSIFLVGIFIISSFVVMEFTADNEVSGGETKDQPMAIERLSGTLDLSEDSANQRFYGTTQYDYGGTGVNSGDVNGDGFDDVIMGARGASSYSGEIWIFYGITNTAAEVPDTNADVVLSAPSGARYFGESIGVGDVDGDGIDDVVAGSYAGSSYLGEAYIWFGSTNLPSSSNSPDVTFVGERGYSSSNYFGKNVWVEDLDNDKVDDVIVVEPYYYERIYDDENFGGTTSYRRWNRTGLTFIFWGRSKTDWGQNNGKFQCNNDDWDVRIKGWMPAAKSGDRNARMGYYGGQALGAGDFNGDGYNDLAVSTGYYCDLYYDESSYYRSTGCVWLIPGRSRADWTQWGGYYDMLARQGDYMMFTQRQDYSYAGYNPRLGDVNGDGLDDLLFCDEESDGNVYILWGRTNTTELRTGTFWNEYPYGGYYNDIDDVYDVKISGSGGGSMSQVWTDDFDGDGIDDILTGAGRVSNPSGNRYAGAVYLFYGKKDWSGGNLNTGDANFTIYGEAQYAYLGYYYYQTLGSGDFNSDGVADLLMGSYGTTGPANARYSGSLYMYLTKQPEMELHGVEILDADGYDGKTVLPGSGGLEDKTKDKVGDGVYSIATGFNDTWTVYEAQEVRIIFQLKGQFRDFRYVMMYDVNNKSFHMIENPVEGMALVLDQCHYNYTSRLSMEVTFSFMFYPWFLTQDLFDVVVQVENSNGIEEIVLEDRLHLEKDIRFLGDDFAVNRDGEPISRGDFVDGGKPITVRGMRVVYEGTDISPQNDRFRVRIVDSYSRIFEDLDSAGREILFEIPTTVDSGIYRFSVEIIIARDYFDYMEQTSVIPIFYINLDFDGPEAPKNLKFHADSPTDPENRWDDDHEVWLSWDPSFDTQQGVQGYYVETTSGTRAVNTKYVDEGTSTNLTLEGTGTITTTVYAIDDSGNIGMRTSTEIIIDTGDIQIMDPLPTYLGNRWYRETEIAVRFSIMDEIFAMNGPELDLRSMEYAVTSERTEAAKESAEWMEVREYNVLDEEEMENHVLYTLEAKVQVSEGKDNYVWFRASDEVGNTGETVVFDPQEAIDEAQAYVDSQTNWTDVEKTEYMDEATEDAYEMAARMNPARIWVDMTPITFSTPTPSSDPLEDKRVTATIQVSDFGSMVDADTVQYSVSRNGITNYGGWINIDTAVDGSNILARTVQPLLFEPGTTNYIRWRAKDVAGNGYTVSEDYAIVIEAVPVNNPPVSEILSPAMSEVYDTKQTISFDGTGSTDPDFDDLSYTWILGNRTPISTEPQFDYPAADLGPGPHVITLEVTDGQWRVTSSISIFVKTHPDEVDTDGDGDPDGSDQDDDDDGLLDTEELEMGTNPRLKDTDLDGKNDKLDPEPLNPLVIETEDEDSEVSYYTVMSLMIVLAVVILLIGSLVVLRRRSSMEKDRIERKALAEGKIESRYEELTGVGAPLLPQVKEMGLTLPPVAAQQVAPMKKAEELSKTPSLPAKEEEEKEEKKAEPMEAPAPTPAPEPAPAPEPVEKKPAPRRRIRRKSDDKPESSMPGDLPRPEELTGTEALPGSAEKAQEKAPESKTTTCDLCGSTIDVPEGASTVECPLCGEKKEL